MNLLEFKSLLARHADLPLRLQLPTGSPVPVAFHVTEVGHVQKTFLDCGGQLHRTETCQLQVWVGDDADHRISAVKIAGILDKARGFLPEDLPVEVEYEDTLISQYAIDGSALEDGAVVLRLVSKHTDCLAKELCGIPSAPAASSCCAKPGCC